MQCEARLDECRDARAALGVADVPLDRTQQARLPPRVLWMSPSALASIMSPRTVPVPCASTKPICPASTSCKAERAAHQLHLGPTVRGGDSSCCGPSCSRPNSSRLRRSDGPRQRRRPVCAAPPRLRPHPGRCRRHTVRTVCSDRPARRGRPGCKRSKVQVSESDSHRRRWQCRFRRNAVRHKLGVRPSTMTSRRNRWPCSVP